MRTRHQKSLVGIYNEQRMLGGLPLVVDEVNSGCCDLPGSLGDNNSHPEVSTAVGEGTASAPRVRSATHQSGTKARSRAHRRCAQTPPPRTNT